MHTLALDPGRNFVGFAYGTTELLACGVSKLPAEGKVWGLDRACEYHANVVESALKFAPAVDRVVVERMGVRLQDAQGRTTSAKLARVIALSNDLLGIQAIGAHIAGRVGGRLWYVQHFLCSKEITQNRVLHLLSPKEQDVLALYKGKKRDDICDAVAHWLRAVGRLS
jgi:hypothetical protein